jgi:hypothetical protein
MSRFCIYIDYLHIMPLEFTIDVSVYRHNYMHCNYLPYHITELFAIKIASDYFPINLISMNCYKFGQNMANLPPLIYSICVSSIPAVICSYPFHHIKMPSRDLEYYSVIVTYITLKDMKQLAPHKYSASMHKFTSGGKRYSRRHVIW